MRLITTDRGSAFYLCGQSAHDPTFPKYPCLPVTQRTGYDPKVLRIHKAGHESLIEMKRTLLSWSSGKDSAWSLHLLRQQNEYEIVGLRGEPGRYARGTP